SVSRGGGPQPGRRGSRTRLMTAVLALERGGLDDVVAIDVDYRQLGDSSTMGLLPGERLTLEDLLYGLLLPSGNDAAIAIARHVAGSEEASAERRNARAPQLGLSATRFANPHGLDAADHYSSPLDILTLGRFAMGSPLFRQIVGTKQSTVQGRRSYTLVNTNRLLGVAPGVD